MATRPAVFGVERSLTGKSWRWRRGNMDLAGDSPGLEDDIVTELLLARGVARDDLARHRSPSLRAFLPDPSEFNDMDLAAERIAEAVFARETVTVYGDYDVDGATSAALLIRLFRMLGHEARHYIPDRLLEGYGPSGEALVRLGGEGSSLVVTVDCGAMAYEALAAAHQAGLQPGEEVGFHLQNEDIKPVHYRVVANSDGMWRKFYVPFLWHRDGGTVHVDLQSASCSLALSFDWTRRQP